MSTPHKLVNGKKVALTEAELAERDARAAEHEAKLKRHAELASLKNFYEFRKNAYEDQLGNHQRQLETMLEDGDMLGIKNIYDDIRNNQYPWTDELRALKDSCTEEELNYCRGK